jgi:hypothetical protein
MAIDSLTILGHQPRIPLDMFEIPLSGIKRYLQQGVGVTSFLNSPSIDFSLTNHFVATILFLFYHVPSWQVSCVKRPP